MLAQNYMTAKELGIDDDLRWALVKVLGQLEREELTHKQVPQGKFKKVSPISLHENGHFNMNWWASSFKCGTVCCIGGWTEYALRDKIRSTTRALETLFHPGFEFKGKPWPDYDEITPAQAACALRNYLTVGQPCWAEALA